MKRLKLRCWPTPRYPLRSSSRPTRRMSRFVCLIIGSSTFWTMPSATTKQATRWRREITSSQLGEISPRLEDPHSRVNTRRLTKAQLSRIRWVFKRVWPPLSSMQRRRRSSMTSTWKCSQSTRKSIYGTRTSPMWSATLRQCRMTCAEPTSASTRSL